MKKTTRVVFVGVDVSKDTLDVFDPGTRTKESRIENEESAVEDFCKKLAKRESSIMLVMEATGGYETRLVRAAARHGIAQAVVNPRQVRDFAHEIGMDASLIFVTTPDNELLAQTDQQTWRRVNPWLAYRRLIAVVGSLLLAFSTCLMRQSGYCECFAAECEASAI